MKRFDRKFGRELLSELPHAPAVYLFKDESGEVLYAGKAKDIRRRLSSYRNAGRRKAERKMRTLVREAHSLEVRLQKSETEALLLENQLIRELRPPFNVDGAFDFLYPAIGTGRDGDRLVLVLSSEPESVTDLDLCWHGTFRPRHRARDAFDALAFLFGRLGHLEPPSRSRFAPLRRGTRSVAFRRVPEPFLDPLRHLLDGEDDGLLALLATALLERIEARRTAAEVEQALRLLARFHRDDALRLRRARQIVGWPVSFVPRQERDALFIRARRGQKDSKEAPCIGATSPGH
jgi:predicted GIY-YIG superfamily endonuclease